MAWRSLPPVGNSVFLGSPDSREIAFEGYRSVWVDSGTSALAMALLLARDRHPGICAPEVVLPGYCCPDLVAAAVFAGVEPVLADIRADDPGYDLDCLRGAISANTVAVIAVNFLGIRDRLDDIRQLLKSNQSVVLIEDNAQWFPEPIAGVSVEGDCSVLSFGRGKPVSLLGGGALLVREELYASSARLAQELGPPSNDRTFRIKAVLYNILRTPRFYGLIARLPMLSIGKTEYHALQSINAMDSQRSRLLSAGVRRYLARERRAEMMLSQVVPERINLPLRAGARTGRLLRYPLVMGSSQERDRLFAALTAAGLGASTMYACALSAMQDVKPFLGNAAATPNASDFASRLLTLPTHAGVDLRAVTSIERVLKG